MITSLKEFKLVLDKADEELKIAARAQTTESIEYEEAKSVYRRAYYGYITAMNEFCRHHQLRIEFDPTKCYDTKYNH